MEFNTAQAPLFVGEAMPTGEKFAPLRVTGNVWLIIPFAIGLWRLLHAEPT